MLDVLDKTLDRLKVMYEQYFLGIQKQAPAYLHTDVERKLRDLTQISIRNTGLRYRFATVQQKFGSYNSYWRRTLRQIENGTYGRNLSKIGRQAARSGEAIPEEILAAMPKRMREQVVRDREQAIATNARRKAAKGEDLTDEQLLTLPSEYVSPPALPPEADDDVIAMISEPTELRRDLKTRTGAHVIDDSDDLDIDSFFASVEQKDPEPPVAPAPPRPSAPAGGVPIAARQPGTHPANPAAARPSGPVRVQPDPVPVTPTGQPPVTQQTGSVRAVAPPGTPAAARQTGPVGIVSPGAPRPNPNPAAARQTGPVGVVSPGTPRPDPAAARPTGPVGLVPPGTPPPNPSAARQTGPIGVGPPGMPPPNPARQTGPIGVGPPGTPPPNPARQTGPIGVGPPATPPPNPAARQTGPVRVVSSGSPAGTDPRAPVPPVRVVAPEASDPPDRVGLVPPPASAGGLTPPPRTMPTPAAGTGVIPKRPAPVGPNPSVSAPPVAAKPLPSITTTLPTLPLPTGDKAPSQAVRPNPIAPGAAAAHGDAPVESMSGPFPRTPPAEPPRAAAAPLARPVVRPPAQPRPEAAPPQRPPPGMTDADVNALYAKYVKAKEAVGEIVGPGGHAKLLKTINAQAPKIMEQYKAKAVDFSVVVKDNQVIIRAKPKT